MVTATANLAFRISIQNQQALQTVRKSLMGISQIGKEISGRRAQLAQRGFQVDAAPTVQKAAATRDKNLRTQVASNDVLSRRVQLMNAETPIARSRLIILGEETNRRKTLLAQEQLSIKVGSAAATIRANSNLTDKESIALANRRELFMAKARAHAEVDSNNRRRALAERREQIIAERQYSRNLMMTSISMFVLTITVTQALTAFQQLFGAETLAGKAIGEFTTFVKLALGPMQVYIALLQIINIQNKKMLLSALPLLGVFLGLALVVKAFQTESKALRVTLLTLGAVISVVSTALFLLRTATIASTIASIFKMEVESLGALTPIILLSLGLAAGLAGALVAMTSFQTRPGQFFKVGSTGVAQVHKDEIIGTPGEGGFPSMGNGGGDTFITVHGDFETELARRLDRRFRLGQNIPFTTG